ncbi:hypothetical protein ASD31_03235 [Rhizobium sp. Root482]|nr:hypothetical protein ASD31_03235 [Rhizobium sp. Root482]
MTDSHTKDLMQAMAQAIDEAINGRPLPAEKQFGFVLLIFAKDGEAGNRTNYVSNCDRRDILAALKEITARFEGQAAQSGRA